MKSIFALGFLAIASVAYADGSTTNVCANNNPYLQHACEQSQQNAANQQKALEANEAQSAKQTDQALQKQQQEAAKPVENTAPTLPAWQQAITPKKSTDQNQGNQNGSANTENSDNNSGGQSAGGENSENPVPPLSPPTVAGPQSVKGPGALDLTPVKKDNNTGAIKYY